MPRPNSKGVEKPTSLQVVTTLINRGVRLPPPLQACISAKNCGLQKAGPRTQAYVLSTKARDRLLQWPPTLAKPRMLCISAFLSLYTEWLSWWRKNAGLLILQDLQTKARNQFGSIGWISAPVIDGPEKGVSLLRLCNSPTTPTNQSIHSIYSSSLTIVVKSDCVFV